MGKKKKLSYEELSIERKEMQHMGTMPKWFSTAGWQLFKDRYLYKTQTVEGQYKRIARTAAEQLPSEYQKEGYEKFFNMLWNGILSPSTPVLSNAGTNRGLVVSCQGAYMEDSILGIVLS